MINQRFTSFILGCLLSLSCIEARANWLKYSSLLKPGSHSSSFSRVSNNLLVRGGADKATAASEPIKGCCIGIDLGTTFR